jgi:putative addiction module CopG family antidote
MEVVHVNVETDLPAPLRAWLETEVAGGRFDLASDALLKALRRVAYAEAQAQTRLAELRLAVQAGMDGGNAGPLDMAAIKLAGRTRQASSAG